MILDETQKSFIEKRKKLIKAWPFAGYAMLTVIGIFLIWQWIRIPIMVNPVEIISRINSGVMEQSTLFLIAVMMPVLFVSCFFILAVMILFIFLSISNEKKYHRIIESLSSDG
ncbi:hypothetical protein ACFLTD_02110 [Elusimicrobiota bacterium]